MFGQPEPELSPRGCETNPAVCEKINKTENKKNVTHYIFVANVSKAAERFATNGNKRI